MEKTEEFNCILLDSFTSQPYIGKRKKVAPSPGQVLVKVMRSTVNPSDMFYILGAYGLVNPEKFPTTPGFEGSGIIEAVGDNVSKDLVGKYCSIIDAPKNKDEFYGTWSEYKYVDPKTSLLIYDNEIDLDHACFAMINPLTAVCFIEEIKLRNLKSVAHNAAASGLGQTFVKLCKENNITLINVVRKEEQVKTLKDLGAEIIINTAVEGWEKEFSKTTSDHDCRLMFECVGGKMTSTLLSLMPNNSSVSHYGNLSLEGLDGFSTGDFIFKNKKLEGFWLNTFFAQHPNLLPTIFGTVKKGIENSKESFKPIIAKEVKLDELLKTLPEYKQITSSGKILIKLH